MNVKILLIAAMSLAALSAEALVSQRITLKNGSTLDGYIALQKPGENIQFQADEYHIILKGADAKQITDKTLEYKEVSAAWRKWADDNNAWLGEGDARKFQLSDIVTADGKTMQNVRVTAKGSQVHYVGLSPRIFSLSWDTIQSVSCEKRKPTELSGVNRIYTLDDDQTVEGQYLSEIPGEAIAILDDKGMIQYFESDRIAKYTLTKVNPEQSIYAQSDLVDVVVKKENSLTSRGIIIERNYAQAKSANNYLIIQAENGAQEKILFSQVKEYRKEPNKAYDPQEDILLEEGELYINRMKADSVMLNEEDDRLLLENDSCKVEILKQVKTTVVTVECRQPKEGSAEVKVMKVEEYKPAKKKEATRYGFSYKDLTRTAIAPKETTVTVNKTCKLVFDIAEPGDYVVYDYTHQMAYPFTIK